MVNTLVGMTPTDRKGWCGHIGHCVCCEHTCGRTGEWTGLGGEARRPGQLFSSPQPAVVTLTGTVTETSGCSRTLTW